MRYVYAGNRSTVLCRMLELGLNVQAIFPTAGSWLEKQATSLGPRCMPVTSKSQLVDHLNKEDFDVFISTGCKFILPISQLKSRSPQKVFVNVHPSPLPDLRGADPIPGAILFGRDSGVTCHLMDDGIDTGPIVASETIPYFDGLDSQLLYRACFSLEPRVFEIALNKGFSPIGEGPQSSNKALYYSFREGDNAFRENDSSQQIVAKVRAFNTPAKRFIFQVGGEVFRALGAELIPKSFFASMGTKLANDGWKIILVIEDTLVMSNGVDGVRLFGIDPLPDVNITGLSVLPCVTGEER